MKIFGDYDYLRLLIEGCRAKNWIIEQKCTFPTKMTHWRTGKTCYFNQKIRFNRIPDPKVELQTWKTTVVKGKYHLLNRLETTKLFVSWIQELSHEIAQKTISITKPTYCYRDFNVSFLLNTHTHILPFSIAHVYY